MRNSANIVNVFKNLKIFANIVNVFKNLKIFANIVNVFKYLKIEGAFENGRRTFTRPDIDLHQEIRNFKKEKLREMSEKLYSS